MGVIRDQPRGIGTALGKALVLGPALGAGGIGFIGTARAIGTRGAAIETVAAFAPFQVRRGAFGPLGREGADLQFDVASFRQTSGDVTRRLIAGRDVGGEGVTLLSRQVSRRVGGGEIGFAVTDISGPVTTFRPGTGFLEGFRTIRTESIVGGLPGQATRVRGIDLFTRTRGIDTPSQIQALGQLTQTDILSVGGTRGFAGVPATRRVADITFGELPRGRFGATAEFFRGEAFTIREPIGGLARGVGSDLTLFGAGPGREVDIRGLTKIPGSDLVIPTRVGRRIRVEDFSIRGLELDVGARATREAGSGLGIGRGGFSGTGVGTQSIAKQIGASIQSTKAAITPISRPPRAARPDVISSLEAPQFISSLQTPDIISTRRPNGVELISSRGPVSILREETIPLVDVRPISTVGVSQRLETRLATRTRQDLLFTPAQITGQITGQDFRLISGSRTIQEQALGLGRPRDGDGLGFGFEPFGGAPIIPLGGFGLPLFPTLRGERRVSKGRKKRPTRIAPSLTGVVAFDLGDIVGGPLPTGEGALGVLPSQLRLIPGTPRKKKSKKKSSKK